MGKAGYERLAPRRPRWSETLATLQSISFQDVLARYAQGLIPQPVLSLYAAGVTKQLHSAQSIGTPLSVDCVVSCGKFTWPVCLWDLVYPNPKSYDQVQILFRTGVIDQDLWGLYQHLWRVSVQRISDTAQEYDRIPIPSQVAEVLELLGIEVVNNGGPL